MAPSRNALHGKIINVRRGLAIYKVRSSPYYRARIWLPGQKKRLVKTTKTTVRIEAISMAEEWLGALGSRGQLVSVPQTRRFKHFAEKLVELERVRGEEGRLNLRQWRESKNVLNHPKWGANSFFDQRDVGTIRTKDYLGYLAWVREQDPSLSAGTINHIAVVFRKVLSVAQQDGVIEAVPATPRERRKDNPRPFFRFQPLVAKQDDEYQLLLDTAKALSTGNCIVRGVPVTEELCDFIIFLTNSFVRPTTSEVFSLRHRDVAIAENPSRLLLTIKKGKTGYRVSNSLEAAVQVYKRIVERNKGHSREDYLFFPAYKNRSHAQRIVQRQFNVVLDRCGLKQDRNADTAHTVYSLRHTAICMRLILSEGKVNIFNLAKNAGTSVEQIERFYARNLPLSAELARNLHSSSDGTT